MSGFLNLRGSILPVVRAAALFEITLPTARDPHIIVIGGEADSPFGLLVDATEDILSVPPDGLRALPPEHIVNQSAEGEFTVEGKTYTLLDCDRLMLAEEMRRIAELRSQVARRMTNVEAALP